jgi:hypothetical protein
MRDALRTSQESGFSPETAPRHRENGEILYTYRASCTNQVKAKAPSSSLGVPAAPPAATPYTSAARAA